MSEGVQLPWKNGRYQRAKSPRIVNLVLSFELRGRVEDERPTSNAQRPTPNCRKMAHGRREPRRVDEAPNGFVVWARGRNLLTPKCLPNCQISNATPGSTTRVRIQDDVSRNLDLPPSSAPIAIEFQRLGIVLRWSECQAIVKNAVWLKIGRRSKQNLDS
jgi:hypothetical protein